MARRLWFSGQQGFHSLPGARCATWGGDSGLPGSASELEPLTPSLCAHANSRQPGGPIQSLSGAAWRADGDRLPHCISRMASFIFWFICWPVISQDCDLRVADYCLPWGVCLWDSTLAMPLVVGGRCLLVLHFTPSDWASASRKGAGFMACLKLARLPHWWLSGVGPATGKDPGVSHCSYPKFSRFSWIIASQFVIYFWFIRALKLLLLLLNNCVQFLFSFWRRICWVPLSAIWKSCLLLVFVRWKLRPLIWNISFLIYTFDAIDFPLGIALAASHNFWQTGFIFLQIKIFSNFPLTSFLKHCIFRRVFNFQLFGKSPHIFLLRTFNLITYCSENLLRMISILKIRNTCFLSLNGIYLG